MTHEQKIEYIGIAADLCKFHFSYEQMDLLINLYELILEKKGDADMKTVLEIKNKVQLYAIEKKKLLDESVKIDDEKK